MRQILDDANMIIDRAGKKKRKVKEFWSSFLGQDGITVILAMLKKYTYILKYVYQTYIYIYI